MNTIDHTTGANCPLRAMRKVEMSVGDSWLTRLEDWFGAV